MSLSHFGAFMTLMVLIKILRSLTRSYIYFCLFIVVLQVPNDSQSHQNDRVG
jgi:hypothetical protein